MLCTTPTVAGQIYGRFDSFEVKILIYIPLFVPRLNKTTGANYKAYVNYRHHIHVTPIE